MNRVHEQRPKFDSGTVLSQTGPKIDRVHQVHSPGQPARPAGPRLHTCGASRVRLRPRSCCPRPCACRALASHEPVPRAPARLLAQLPVAPSRVPHAGPLARARVCCTLPSCLVLLSQYNFVLRYNFCLLQPIQPQYSPFVLQYKQPSSLQYNSSQPAIQTSVLQYEIFFFQPF